MATCKSGLCIFSGLIKIHITQVAKHAMVETSMRSFSSTMPPAGRSKVLTREEFQESVILGVSSSHFGSRAGNLFGYSAVVDD